MEGMIKLLLNSLNLLTDKVAKLESAPQSVQIPQYYPPPPSYPQMFHPQAYPYNFQQHPQSSQ